MLRRPYRRELVELARLAGPLAAVQLGNQLMGFVDTAIVGRLGAVELGAVGLANAVFFAFAVFGMGLMMGLDPLVAQALGAGDRVRARTLLWQAVWLALLIGGLLMLPLLAMGPVFELAGIDAQTAARARGYLVVRAPGLIPPLLFTGARSYLQALGRTRSLVIGVVAANLINLGATLLLVFGGAGLPAWAGPLRAVPALGVVGAAAASTLCVLVQLAAVLPALRRLVVPGFETRRRRPARVELGRALRVGGPIGLQMLAEVGAFTLIAFLAGRLGSGSLAAHQVALTLAGFSFTVALGVSAAGSVRVGQAIGAGDTAGTRRAGLTAFAAGGGFMACSALVFFLFPETLAAVMSDRPEVLAAATPLVIVAAFFQISDGLQAVGSGVLRGAGDTRFAFVTNLLGHYVVGLPIAIGLGIFAGKGITGLWWGLCAGLTAVGVTLLVRFARLSKRGIKPLTPSGAAERVARAGFEGVVG
ncbi:MAG TPA: MATE family efflux transporter [Myxococcales bacterium]|nr:MATE family efflux transporter [Myxococcales bacterium]